MRTITSLFALTLVVLFASSCKKIENPTPIDVIENAGSATITGYAYCQSDLTNAGQELANGAKIIVTIDPTQFPGSNHTSGTLLRYETTVDADGMWSITVPAPDKLINATVWPQEFRRNLIVNANTTLQNEIFDANSINVTIINGKTDYLDINY